MSNGKIAVIKDPALHYSSKSYQLLESIMFEVVGIDRVNVKIIDLDPFLKISDVDVIIAVGEKPLLYLTDLKGITRYAGTIQESAQGIPVVPIVSPGYVEYNPNYLRKFADDILIAYQTSMGIGRKELSNQYKIITDMSTLIEVIGYIKQSGYCSFDFETTELTDMGTFDPDFYCTTLSLSFQQGSSYVIPLHHADSPFNDKQLEEIFCRLGDYVFGNPDITKVGQHVKFDMHCLAWCGVTEFRGPYHDTMLLHQLYDENLSHKLKDIIRDFYPQFANYEKNLGLRNWADIPLDNLARYNALDSDLTLRLYWWFTNILLEDERLYLMYRNLTAPATKALFFMEERGMLIDKEFLINSIKEVENSILDQETIMRKHSSVINFEEYKNELFLQEYINTLATKIEKLKNTEFKTKKAQENNKINIETYKTLIAELESGKRSTERQSINFNSPEQLKELLFSKEGFGFPLPKNNYGEISDSTEADNLDLIKDPSGFIEQLIITRQLKKIVNTYLSSILEKLDNDHYIHTTFNQQVAKTGRLSSNKPNLQNIITRTKYKVVEDSVALVKKSFIVPEGYTLVEADYSQIELRIIAHYAQEDTMIEAYKNGKDLHEITAANSHGYTLENFKKLDPKLYEKYRFEAKAENFGFIYGISSKGFREYARTTYNLNISQQEAEKRRAAYFKKYPKLLNYHQIYKEKARKYKYVRTFFGRKVHLPDIDSINNGIQGHAERNAINSPIQGTAGEITIWATVLLSLRLSPQIFITNEIHDADYFYIPDQILNESVALIQETMENLPLKQYFYREIDSLPIKVDFKVSKNNWKDLRNI